MKDPASQSDVATFLNVNEQFARLKKRGLELKATTKARERGYFIPQEDEAAAHLYVSYIHTRNALLESVLEQRDSAATLESPQEFLLCLGGALLLVDAAVFVRDTFGDDPTVRTKLNEAIPSFGIPAGTYDHIQKSLTCPTNNWHIYQARKHFENNRGHLLAQAPGCKPVSDRIEELSQRHRMDPAAYIKERVDVRRMELAKNIRSNLLGRLVYEIQKSFASLMADLSTRPGHQPGLPPEVDAAARGILQPGDVLLTRKEHVFTNYFLPGFWPHGALNLGTHDELVSLGLRERKHFSSYEAQIQELQLNDPSRSIEALKDGVHLRTLASPLGADSVVILRPKLASDQLADALDRVLQHTDKPYDFDFDFTRADRMVCTEVIYRAYDGIADLRFKLARRAGRMTLSAMDIIHMALAGKHFSIVATHIPSASQDLLTGDTAQQAVRNLA